MLSTDCQARQSYKVSRDCIGQPSCDRNWVITLTNQHRVHPHIAELVGKIFYQDSFGGTILRSPTETHTKFAGEPPFDISPASWLPRHRIVWGDVPWIQRRQYSAGETAGLFVSPFQFKTPSRPYARITLIDDRLSGLPATVSFRFKRALLEASRALPEISEALHVSQSFATSDEMRDDLADDDQEGGKKDISEGDQNEGEEPDRIPRKPDGHPALGADHREAGAWSLHRASLEGRPAF